MPKKPRPFNLEIDGEKKKLRPDNCGIALFHTDPDNDYLDYWEKEGGEDSERHWWVFNQREFLLWMGGVAVMANDVRVIALANSRFGSFDEEYGWRPTVCVEYEPRPYERDLFIAYETRSLEDEWDHLLDGEGDGA